MIFLRTLSLTAILALCVSFSAQSQQQYRKVLQHYSSGTGFFVSKNGYVITNEHVIRECQSGHAIQLKGAVQAEARLIATDVSNDLALLRANSYAPNVARLRGTASVINRGEDVLVMGYPLDAAVTGTYRIAQAQVIDLIGPTGEPNWLQFTDSAQKGNSGGPLLDPAGNVIGVVSGKTQLFAYDRRSNRNITISSSDVAVTLEPLKKFLRRYNVKYERSQTFIQKIPSLIERTARGFVVQVRCVTGEEYIS